MGPDTTPIDRAQLVIDIDHHHDNTRFGDVNLIVADASSTGEVLRDVFAELGVELTPEIAEPLYIALVTDTGRFQYTNTTPKSLRLAAELVEAGADVHAVFQQVYESRRVREAEAACACARAGARPRGRPHRRLVSPARRLRRGRRCRAVLGGDHRLPARRRGRGARGAHPRAAARRRPGAARSRCARRSTSSTSRRSRARSAAAATGRPPASRARRRSTRSPSSSARDSSHSVPPRALEPAGVALVDKPAGPSSHAIVAPDPPRDRRPHGACRHARSVRDRAPARVVRTDN